MKKEDEEKKKDITVKELLPEYGKSLVNAQERSSSRQLAILYAAGVADDDEPLLLRHIARLINDLFTKTKQVERNTKMIAAKKRAI